MPTAHAHLDAGDRCTCTSGRQCPMHMHTWAPVPPAHAHLGASSLCPCTPRRQCPMHQDALQLHTCPKRKKGQYMPMRAAANNHKRSAICIGIDFITFVWHVPRTTYGPEKMGDLCRMDVAKCSRLLADTCLCINGPFFPKRKHRAAQ